MDYEAYAVPSDCIQYGITTFEGLDKALCPLDNMNDTECYIYGCENVKSLGDMVNLNVSNITLSQAFNLQYLKLGDANTQNTKLTSLDLSSCKKLKVVDLRNCVNLTGVIDVSNCYSLEELYLDGTQVTAVNLPNGGRLKKLHVPAVSSLIVINHPDITDFVYNGNYSNINTLHVKNAGAIPVVNIVKEMPDRSRVKLEDVSLTFDDYVEAKAFASKFYSMKGIDDYYSEITGTLNVTATIPSIGKDALRRLNLNANQFVVNAVDSGGNTLAVRLPTGTAGNSTVKSAFGFSTTELSSITEAYLLPKNQYTVTGNEIVKTNGNNTAYLENNKLYITPGPDQCISMNVIGVFGGVDLPNLEKLDLTYVDAMDRIGGIPYAPVITNFEWVIGGGVRIEWGNYYTSATAMSRVNLENRFGSVNNDMSEYYDRYMWALRREARLSPIKKLDLDPFRFSFSQISELDFEGMTFAVEKFANFITDTSITKIKNWELITNHPTSTGTSVFPTTLTSMVLKPTSHIDADTNALSTLFKRPPLDLESITSVINALEATETAITLTLNATTFGYLTEEVVAMASAKGYSLASA